jgi:hypothetical protein
MFVGLIILGYMHVCLRILQVVAFDTLSSSPRSPITQMLREVAMFTVNSTTFFDFLRMQSGMVFLAAILAGAGMICDDYKNNLMEVYFSKPMTWRDYVLGKTMTLVIIGLAFTAIPGVCHAERDLLAADFNHGRLVGVGCALRAGRACVFGDFEQSAIRVHCGIHGAFRGPHHWPRSAGPAP